MFFPVSIDFLKIIYIILITHFITHTIKVNERTSIFWKYYNVKENSFALLALNWKVQPFSRFWQSLLAESKFTPNIFVIFWGRRLWARSSLIGVVLNRWDLVEVKYCQKNMRRLGRRRVLEKDILTFFWVRIESLLSEFKLILRFIVPKQSSKKK